MAGELKALLEGLPRLGAGYGSSARRLVADAGARGLVESYEAGLVEALSGLGSVLGEAYDSLPAEKQADFDRLVAVSGMPAMLGRATEVLGGDSLGDVETLDRAADVFDKIARILRDIFDKLELGGETVPPGTTTSKQRDWTENILDWGQLLLRNLIDTSSGRRVRTDQECGGMFFERVNAVTGSTRNEALARAREIADGRARRRCPQRCPAVRHREVPRFYGEEPNVECDYFASYICKK